MKNILALIVSLVLCGAAIAQDNDSPTTPNNNNISTESPAATTTETSEAEAGETAETEATPAATEAAVDTSPVVLELGERRMTQQEFEERFHVFASNYLAQRGIQPTPENIAQIEPAKADYIQNLMTDMVLLNEASQRGIQADTTIVNEQLADIKSNIPESVGFNEMLTAAGFKNETQLRTLMAEVTVIEQLIEQIIKDTEISDEALQAFYDENSEQFARPAQACARHILLDNEEDANAVLAELEAGGDFATLASEHSTGPSASRGGDLECFAQEQMVPEFAEAAFAADIDSPVGPVQTDFGYHLILVYDKKEEGLVELEEVSESIREELTNRAISNYIDGLVSDSEINVNSEFLASLEPTPHSDAPVMDNTADNNDTDDNDTNDTDDNDTNDTDDNDASDADDNDTNDTDDNDASDSDDNDTRDNDDSNDSNNNNTDDSSNDNDDSGNDTNDNDTND